MKEKEVYFCLKSQNGDKPSEDAGMSRYLSGGEAETGRRDESLFEEEGYRSQNHKFIT